MSHKEYIFSLRFFILAASAVFAFAALQGYFTAQNSPSETEAIIKPLQAMLGPIIEMPPLNQFLFIVLNNGITAFLAVLLGLVFGIFSFWVLFSNGIILGVVAYFSEASFPWSVFLLGTLPHGIIEIPVVILACAIGFKLGKVSFNSFFYPIRNYMELKKLTKGMAVTDKTGQISNGVKKEGSIKAELSIALNFFLKVLFPFLILAAAIEIFITARLL